MKSNQNTWKKIVFPAAALVALASLAPARAGANTNSESVSGTLPGYQTTVERQVEGELSHDNLRQASLLGSQILLHLNAAVEELEDRSTGNAEKQIDNALVLIGVIRDMLPITVETTVVRDPTGNEIYRHTERTQDDLIPIYQEMTAVEVVQPVLDVRWNRADFEGLQVADVDLIHTSVLADLSFIERRLKRAKSLYESPDKALGELTTAIARGVRFSVNKQDSPLLDAQRALRLAEKMAEEQNYRAAKANLRVARKHLTVYRGLADEEDKPAIQSLQAEIAKIETDLDEMSPGLIRGFWQRVTNWTSESPGEATATDSHQNPSDASS